MTRRNSHRTAAGSAPQTSPRCACTASCSFEITPKGLLPGGYRLGFYLCRSHSDASSHDRSAAHCSGRADSPPHRSFPEPAASASRVGSVNSNAPGEADNSLAFCCEMSEALHSQGRFWSGLAQTARPGMSGLRRGADVACRASPPLFHHAPPRLPTADIAGFARDGPRKVPLVKLRRCIPRR